VPAHENARPTVTSNRAKEFYRMKSVPESLKKQAEALTAEADKLTKTIDRREGQNRKDRSRLNKIQFEQRRLAIVALIGVPDAVKTSRREAPGDPSYHLNDARGTVLEVKRTIALVKFNVQDKYNGRCRIRFFDLLPAADQQSVSFAAEAKGVGFEEAQPSDETANLRETFPPSKPLQEDRGQ
jgi:hypothetical protein